MNSSPLSNTPTAVKNDIPRHPIQVVARRTGLSADVIRVWERRYGVVTPERQASGRRLYSDRDIQRLTLLQRATDAGRRISEVAPLPDQALAGLVAEDRREADRLPAADAAGHAKAALLAVREMDAGRLNRQLTAAATELPLPLFLDQVVTPLLTQIGDDWERGRLRIGHEHMASAVLRRLLSGMLGREHEGGPLMLFTTVSGQRHELGLLMAAITAESEGWRALYLGPDMPAAEIAAAAIQSSARAVALGLSARSDAVLLSEQLRQLRLALPEAVALVVGGPLVGEQGALLEELGAFTPVDLAQFRETLSAL